MALLAVIAVVALLRWPVAEKGSPEAVAEGGSDVTTSSTADAESNSDSPVPTESGNAQPPPRGMAATLRETNEANRNHILRLTITDKGFECSEVISARRVRDDGLLWRVRCADSQVYSAEVNEYGRLEIAPTPYGDIPIGSAPIIQSPDGDRSLELPDGR